MIRCVGFIGIFDCQLTSGDVSMNNAEKTLYNNVLALPVLLMFSASLDGVGVACFTSFQHVVH